MCVDRGRGYVPGAAPVGVNMAAYAPGPHVARVGRCAAVTRAGYRDSDRGYVPGAALVSVRRNRQPVAAGWVGTSDPSLA